nr:T9SS type A sorting domain-containing protein [FCB group bacterium]
LGPNTPFTVYGTVRDYHEGNPLPAEVIISITDTMGVEYTSEDTIASEAGEYNFSLVSPNEYGNYSILLSAIYDYGIQGTQQLPVLVVVNPAPYFTNAYLPESPEDDTLNINLQDYVEDADSPDSSFAFSVLNGVGMFQYELLDNSLVIIPAADWFGSDSIEIGVTDGTYSTSQYLYFDISPVNDPPESFILLTPENGLIVNHPDSVALTFTWAEAFDIDSENLHYTLSITDSASFDSLFTITDIMELRMNIEDLPRNAPLFWSVIVSDGEYENTSNLTHSFSIDAMVGTVPPIQIPDSYCLEQNFPNPFNPSTTLRYGLPEDANVSLIIYDIRGNLVNMIVSETQAAGWYEHVWNGLDQSGQQVSTGLYLTRLQAGSDNRTIKMLYLK